MGCLLGIRAHRTVSRPKQKIVWQLAKPDPDTVSAWLRRPNLARECATLSDTAHQSSQAPALRVMAPSPGTHKSRI